MMGGGEGGAALMLIRVMPLLAWKHGCAPAITSGMAWRTAMD